MVVTTNHCSSLCDPDIRCSVYRSQYSVRVALVAVRNSILAHIPMTLVRCNNRQATLAWPGWGPSGPARWLSGRRATAAWDPFPLRQRISLPRRSRVLRRTPIAEVKQTRLLSRVRLEFECVVILPGNVHAFRRAHYGGRRIGSALLPRGFVLRRIPLVRDILGS